MLPAKRRTSATHADHAELAGTRPYKTSRIPGTDYALFWFYGRAREPDRYAEKLRYHHKVTVALSDEDLALEFAPLNARIKLGALPKFTTDWAQGVWILIRDADRDATIFKNAGKIGTIVGPFLVPLTAIEEYNGPEQWYLQASKATHREAAYLGHKFYEMLYENREFVWNNSELPAFMRRGAMVYGKRPMPKRLSAAIERRSRSASPTA